MAVDQDGRRRVRATPLRRDHGVARGRVQRNPIEARGGETVGDETGRPLDVRLVLGLRADARDRAEAAQLVDMPVEACRKMGLDVGVHRPPSTLSTWPVIHPA